MPSSPEQPNETHRMTAVELSFRCTRIANELARCCSMVHEIIQTWLRSPPDTFRSTVARRRIAFIDRSRPYRHTAVVIQCDQIRGRPIASPYTALPADHSLVVTVFLFVSPLFLHSVGVRVEKRRLEVDRILTTGMMQEGFDFLDQWLFEFSRSFGLLCQASVAVIVTAAIVNAWYSGPDYLFGLSVCARCQAVLESGTRCSHRL